MNKPMPIVAFLQGIIDEIEVIMLSEVNYIEPVDEIQGDEVLPVEMTDELKALWTLSEKRGQALSRECDAQDSCIDELRGLDDSEETLKAAEPIARHIMDHQRQILIDKIFWQGVEELCPVKMLSAGCDGSSVGIRKGWKVVIAKSERNLEAFATEIGTASALTGFFSGRRGFFS